MAEDLISESAPDLDMIVLGGNTSTWLRRNQLAPSTWNLSKQEIQRILAARVGLFVFHSPVFALDLRPNEAGITFAGHLICFDAQMVESQAGDSGNPARRSLLNREEAIAMILHEIGHRINKWLPPRDPAERMIQVRQRGKYSEEYDADDYARHCGFGEYLVSGLQKLVAAEIPHFDTEVNRQRIARLKNGAGVQLHFNEVQR